MLQIFERIRERLRDYLSYFGARFFLTIILIGGITNAIIFSTFFFLGVKVHSLYTQTLIKNVKSHLEFQLERTYEEFLRLREPVNDPLVVEELYGHYKLMAEKSLESLLRPTEASYLGIKLLLKENPEGLRDFELIEFQPFSIKVYLGASKEVFNRFVLILALGLFLGLAVVFGVGFWFVLSCYRRFRSPLVKLISELEERKELRLTGFKELDSLVLAIKHSMERERELLLAQSKLQLELERQARLSAIGTMAGGYAHEFNNLLQMIVFQLELAERAIKPLSCEVVERYFNNIKDIIKRGQDLARRILFMTKSVPGEKSRLCEVIQSLTYVLRTMVPRDIELKFEFNCPRTCVVTLPPDALKEILINLIKNAIDAIEEVKDKITKREIKVEVKPTNGYFMLSISDTGCGMTEEVKANLFHPFFTTKGFEKGSGLGLFIVYNLVTRAGGRIEVESEVMKGTTFRIYLPSALEEEQEKREEPQAKVAPQEDLKPSFRKILVVDDEEDIRSALEDYLTDLGFEVETAKNGREALELLSTKKYDLLLMDMFMPEMSGTETLIKLIEKGISLPYTIIMTGFAGESHELLDTLLKEGKIKKVLRKPFTFKDLEEALKG